MEFWLSFNNGAEKLRLPVPPPSFMIRKGTNVNVVNINELGDLGIIGKGRLADFNISSFFPAKPYPFVQYRGFPSPYECVAMIERWRESGKPIRLIVTKTDINMAFTITDFEYGERDGTRDVYFSLDVMEYKFVNVKMSKNTSYKNATNKISTNRPTKAVETKQQKTHTVKSGDTLWALSKKFYGSGAKWKELASKNGIKDPRKLQIGKVLVI